MADTSEGEEKWLFVNDWPMRRFLLLNLILIIGLSLFTLVRNLAGSFTYFSSAGFIIIPLLIFLPGSSILRVLRIHGLGMARSVVYSLALSVISLMVLGAGLNSLHYLGIVERPLTLNYITIAFCGLMLILSYLALRNDRSYEAPKVQHRYDLTLVLTIAFAILLPFVVIVAATVADYHGSRELMVYAVMGLCLVPLVALSAKTKHYELLILSLSMALLFHRALMTDYLQGYDIFSEYRASSITVSQGWWNVTESLGTNGGGANTALSIVTLSPMLGNLAGIDPLQTLKVVYPFIFAFVPLGIFSVIKSQLDNRYAFVGACLFMSYAAFFNLMIQLGKQEIAEVFLVGVLLILTEELITRSRKRALLYVFIAGIMLSHYAIAYLSIVMLVGLVFFYAVLFVLRRWKSWRADQDRVRFPSWVKSTARDWFSGQMRSQLITIELVVFFLGFFLLWFTYTGSGVVMTYMGLSPSSVSSIAAGTGTVSTSILQIDAVQYLLINSGTGLHNMDKFLVVMMQLLSVVGLLFLFRNRGGRFGKVKDDFLLFGLVAATLLLASYTIPGISNSLYFGRIFTLTLLFLCGFFAVGVFAIISTVQEIFKGRKARTTERKVNAWVLAISVSSIFVFLMLVSGTGVINSISGEYNNNFSLDDRVSWSIYSDSDVTTAKWVSDLAHRGDYSPVADWHRFPIFGGLGTGVSNLMYQMDENDTNVLIYLSDWNAQYRYVYPLNTANSASLTYSSLSDVLKQVNGTYDVMYTSSGNSYIIYIPAATGPVNTNSPGASIYTYDDYSIVYFLAGIGITLAALLIVSKYVMWARRNN